MRLPLFIVERLQSVTQDYLVLLGDGPSEAIHEAIDGKGLRWLERFARRIDGLIEDSAYRAAPADRELLGELPLESIAKAKTDLAPHVEDRGTDLGACARFADQLDVALTQIREETLRRSAWQSFLKGEPQVDAPDVEYPWEKRAPLRCSFCGKRQSEVKKLIAGPSMYICNECVELCSDIIAEEMQPATEV